VLSAGSVADPIRQTLRNRDLHLRSRDDALRVLRGLADLDTAAAAHRPPGVGWRDFAFPPAP
jgi:hypothetical protein